MKLRTPPGSGDPPERFDWISAVVAGAVAGAAGPAGAAARCTPPPQLHGSPDEHAHRETSAGLAVAEGWAAIDGSGIRMTAVATEVASISAGSCGDDTSSGCRWTLRATKRATPWLPSRCCSDGAGDAADRWTDGDRWTTADAGCRSAVEGFRASARWVAIGHLTDHFVGVARRTAPGFLPTMFPARGSWAGAATFVRCLRHL